MSVVIDTFRPEHAAAFDSLNRAWLTAYDLLEPVDELHLTDPAGAILAHGGQIFVALEDDVVIGTCGVVPHGPGTFEVVKLTVAPTARGRGIARELVDACLAYAVQQRARQVVLVSNSRLQAALRLYERLGFRYAPMPAAMPYATADVYMELELAPGLPAAPARPPVRPSA
ncbi:MAG TPA: GNAT family N-acetyltransferase [Gemmatimonadales bacterium]|nr:GNAT family N-acetyltransferase [Gemmatimonadales bacterium]